MPETSARCEPDKVFVSCARFNEEKDYLSRGDWEKISAKSSLRYLIFRMCFVMLNLVF